jgi:hypothetical protein
MIDRYLVRARRVAAVALCLLMSGCGLISIGVSNDPGWCPEQQGRVGCPP